MLLLATGTTDLVRALVFTTTTAGGTVKSLVTRGFIIENPVGNLTITNPPMIDMTGKHGVGNPWTPEVQLQKQPVLTFPLVGKAALKLPDVIVDLNMNPELRASFSEDDVDWLRTTIDFAVYSRKDLDTAANAQQTASNAVRWANALNRSSLTSQMGDDGSAVKSSVEETGPDAVGVLNELVQLLVSGSMPLAGPATAVGSRQKTLPFH